MVRLLRDFGIGLAGNAAYDASVYAATATQATGNLRDTGDMLVVIAVMALATTTIVLALVIKRIVHDIHAPRRGRR